MHQVILRHPIPQVSWQQHRRIAVHFDETLCHRHLLTERTFQKEVLSKSDTHPGFQPWVGRVWKNALKVAPDVWVGD
jgi:hypothetical protein